MWDQYKFKWLVPCIEVVLFKRFQSHYIDKGDKFGDLVLSIVERCPFLGGSSLRGSTVFHFIAIAGRYSIIVLAYLG